MTRCAKRLTRGYVLVSELLAAWDRSEMSNVVEALDKLRKWREHA